MPLLAVLVRTRNPGNLGAAARVAKNFGADLALIAPRTEVLHPDAVAYASGAEDLLRRMRTFASWDELISREDDVIALSSMRGRITRGLPPPVTFEEVSRSLRRGRRVAFVFGPERGGLTADELRECDARLRIETSPAFPSLNLAQSVAIALAFSLSSSVASPRQRRGRGETAVAPATSKELARLKAALRSTLASAGFAGPGRNRHVVAELESSLLRTRLTAREVTLWLGALAALGRKRP